MLESRDPYSSRETPSEKPSAQIDNILKPRWLSLELGQKSLLDTMSPEEVSNIIEQLLPIIDRLQADLNTVDSDSLAAIGRLLKIWPDAITRSSH